MRRGFGQGKLKICQGSLGFRGGLYFPEGLNTNRSRSSIYDTCQNQGLGLVLVFLLKLPMSDVAEGAVSSILCLPIPMPMPMPLLGFLCLPMALLGRDDGRRRRFL